MIDSTMQTSGPQGHIVPFTLIQDPGAWLATDYRDNMEQLYVSLTPTDIEEIQSALKVFKSSGIPRTHINQNVFPPLTSEQAEALRVVEDIAQSKEFCPQFRLEPGDLSLMNNHTIIHARSQFEDTIEEPRHLLRTWVEFDGSKKRPLPDHVVALREKAPVLRRPSIDLRSGGSKFLLT